MARIKLEAPERKTLEIEKPDGSIIFLELRNVLVGEVDELEKTIKENNLLQMKGDISSVEFLFRTWEKVLKNFKREDFHGMSQDQLLIVAREINKLRESKEETEKKNQS